jgi:hypothetical protein
MMNRHNPVAELPGNVTDYFGIPLLDDGFDPDDEEIFGHSGPCSFDDRHHVTDEFFV